MNKIKMEQKNISYKSLIHQNQTILSSATVIILHDSKVLVGWNTWREQWELPSGHIEPGEKPIDAALRETSEEVHLNLNHIAYLDSFSVQRSTNEREHLRVVYVSHVNSSVSKEFIYNASEDENNKTQWIPLIQILNMANIDYSDWYILKALYKQLIV
ncbi:NUDIX hydrolase [Leuconostoc mesenteroides]|uniref:NUDIX hydrolase n=1 Tax=Leuconostoc mesenteroides TaxID=1245 RepID=UPI000CF8725A|nr:NUDIX hydrolase [Leuconostoc mesenteroides]SPE13847.1 RNA pyrophosphohydrolase [Leuconostoc mesenteroides]SPE66183.1 RNA pyrophosphohydrolase [Leuconostoc mesenteroides]SPI59385.1 RNA pyrophosphohydrolase [Leuconostoc mesenteroides]